jgi:hypothetical protein
MKSIINPGILFWGEGIGLVVMKKCHVKIPHLDWCHAAK